MAKLFLKFEQAVLKEIQLTQSVVTIGRLPDNVVQVDNLAVSGHHAKIYWDQDHFVIEDNNSLNGTYLNNRRISKSQLKDSDVVLIGKHTVVFKDEGMSTPPPPGGAAAPSMPKLEATMVLDTKKAKEMLAAAVGGAAAAAASAAASTDPGVKKAATGGGAAEPPKDRTGTLTVMEGKTDEHSYVLSGKMSVIGKSDMASIKLKGFFAPSMAALINKRDYKYYIAASEAKIKVKINGEEVSGQKELNEGDIIEVAGVKMAFGFKE